MGTIFKAQPFNKVFTDARARDAADAVVMRMSDDLPMHAFIDAWEQAYFNVAGKSPMRTTLVAILKEPT